MSLSSLMRDVVDVVRVDDTTTGNLGGSLDVPTVVAAGVRCRVHDLPPDTLMAFAHEMLRVSHKVHFAAFMKLDPTHRLVWTDPDDGQVRTLKVQGTKRPKAASMPYVVYAEEQVT